MMIDKFEDALKKLEISMDEFSELMIRLLDYGVISRDESQIESELYDRFLQCISLVEDYLSVIKVTLQHDKKFCFVRAFPPGAKVPGMQNEMDPAFQSGFRIKPSSHEISVILILRVEYEKALREGLVDEQGCVMLSLEAVSIGLKNLLNRSLPDHLGERKSIFRHLRQLRLIKFNNEVELDSDDSWLSIQASITSFVSDDVLRSLAPENETAWVENNHVY